MEIKLSDGNGVIERYSDFPSRYVDVRPVDVWCPAGYHQSPDRHYPVLYMQDGQNLFEPTLSAYTGIDWGVDEAINQLMATGQIEGAIVVGVWNIPARWQEYRPPKALPPISLLAKRDGRAYSDNYVSFLVEEVKPFIDVHYRTRPEQAHTFIMGSSMGGLISLYALEEYPEIFGGAGCLSTHWPAGEQPLVDYLGQHLPAPGRHKLYFDYGTVELDSYYEPYQQLMDEWLQKAGYTAGQNWLTQKFEGANHSEAAWRARLHIPLRFLLGN